MARVFGDIEDVWAALFKTMGNPPYPMPTVVLFSFGTSSACGLVRAEVGPIYCPADSQIYVDPDFLGELSRRTTLSATSRKRIYSPVRSGITYKTRSARCRSSSAPCRRWTTHGVSSYKCAESYRRTVTRVSGLFYVQRRHLLAPGDLEEGVPAAQNSWRRRDAWHFRTAKVVVQSGPSIWRSAGVQHVLALATVSIPAEHVAEAPCELQSERK